MHKIMAIFGLIQFCIILIIASRFTPQFPLAFSNISGEYFRGLSVPPISPQFVFVLGNAIVIILLLKSGQTILSKDNGQSAASRKNIDVSDEYTKKYAKDQNEQSKKQRKQSFSVSGKGNNKIFRSQSENYLKEAAGKELRWHATFTCRKRNVAATNEMSNEEFRRTVEDFIARQQRTLREEEFSTLLVSCES